jgi:hypothetical protein
MFLNIYAHYTFVHKMTQVGWREKASSEEKEKIDCMPIFSRPE